MLASISATASASPPRHATSTERAYGAQRAADRVTDDPLASSTSDAAASQLAGEQVHDDR